MSACRKFLFTIGAVAKWLRQRIANPSYPGSSPGGAYPVIYTETKTAPLSAEAVKGKNIFNFEYKTL